MKRIIKIFIFASILFLFYSTSEAQVYKLRAYQFSFKTYSYYSGWSNWSDWSSVKILIVCDIGEQRIKIYSETEQEYDILETNDEQTDYEGNRTLKIIAIDRYGVRCHIRIVNDINENKQLYIDYADAMWVYNVYKLD